MSDKSAPIGVCIALLLACQAEEHERHGGRRAVLETRSLPAADYQREIGTAHPALVIASADSGRWVVACQARVNTDDKAGIRVRVNQHGSLQGDAMTAYLFRGGGDGLPIDALADASPDGRWLAVIRDGKLVLIDDVNGTESTLPDADTRPDQDGFGRIAAFDAESKRAVYLRWTGAASAVVIRDLERQYERELSLPRMLVWQVVPGRRGSWARLLFVGEDTNRDGDLEWPSFDRAAPTLPCTAPPASYSRSRPRGDHVQEAWLNLDTGELRQDPAVLAYLGDAAVTRSADRAVRVGSTELVPAACDANVRAVSHRPLRVIATCQAGALEKSVELFGPGFHVVLDGTSVKQDRSHGVAVLEEPYFCLDREVCYRLQDGKPLRWKGAMEVASEAKLVIQERGSYSILDASTGAVTPLAGVAGDITAVRRGIIAIDNVIVDLASARVLGEVSGAPLALDLAGRALVAAAGGKRDFVAGPLRWTVATPLPMDSAPSVDAGVDPPWTIHGMAIDRAGRPVSNATVTVSETLFTDDDRASAATWVHPARGSRRSDATIASHQSALASKTDHQGEFTWTPRTPGPHAVMIIADDGRIGSIDKIHAGHAALTVQLGAPGALRISCIGFELGDTDGGVDVVAGARRLDAECGQTIGGLPAGRYSLLAKPGAFRYAVRDASVRGGVTTDVVLAVPPAGTIVGRVVEYPGDRPVSGLACDARAVLGDDDVDGDPRSISAADGSFVVRVSQGRFHVWCESYDDEFAMGMASVDLRRSARVTVRVVRYRRDAVDVGVAFEDVWDGARVSRVQGRAARAGIRPGDIVHAVDGIALAGLSARSMAALAFEFPRRSPIRWTVLRDGQSLTILAPPLR